MLNLDIESAEDNEGNENFFTKVVELKDSFAAALNDDFNTAEAIGVLHDLVGEINSFLNQKDFTLNEKNFAVLEETEEIFLELAEILGLKFELNKAPGADDKLVSPLISLLLELRDRARDNKNWEEADLIRDRLQEIGVEVTDTPRGTEWEIKGKEE